MTHWLAHLEDLAKELCAVGVDVSDTRLANLLVGGLAPQYDSVKQALCSCRGSYFGSCQGAFFVLRVGDLFSVQP